MRNRVLLVAAFLSAAIAALHLVIIFVGAPGYRYFGAGEEMARQAESGSLFPAAITLVVAVIFCVFSAYALSGAGVIRRLPLLKTGLVAIGAIYTLRGLVVFAQIRQLHHPGFPMIRREIVFSAVSLFVGIVHLVGTVLRWRQLSKTTSPLSTPRFERDV